MLVQWFKSNNTGKVECWTDEKLFMVDQEHNQRNNRHIVPWGTMPAPIMPSKNLRKEMAFALIVSDGSKGPLPFIEHQINIDVCVQQMLVKVADRVHKR